MGIGVQQSLGHQDHSRGAETALKCAVGNESLLDRMQLSVLCKSLNCQNLRAIDQRGEVQATRYSHPIHQYCAAPAQSLTTAFPSPIKSKLPLQHLHQIFVYGDVGPHLALIQGKADRASVRLAHFIHSPAAEPQPHEWRAKLSPA